MSDSVWCVSDTEISTSTFFDSGTGRNAHGIGSLISVVYPAPVVPSALKLPDMTGKGYRARIRSPKSAKRTGKRKKAFCRKAVPYFADHQGSKKWRSVCTVVLHEYFKRDCHLMNCIWRLDFKGLSQVAIVDCPAVPGKLRQIFPYSFR